MSGGAMITIESVVQYKEQIQKEQDAARDWEKKYGYIRRQWRPVEPVEAALGRTVPKV